MGRVWGKSPPKTKVLPPKGMFPSPVRFLKHLLMVSSTGRDIIEVSSKINSSIPLISCLTLLFGAILQLLPSLHGTGNLKVEWMVRPNFNNVAGIPVHAAVLTL